LPTWTTISLHQAILAELEALGHFQHAIRAGRHGVLEFDGGLDRPLVVAKQLQRFFDWRIALAERDVLILQRLVLDVQVRDPAVVLLQERDRGGLVPADEVPDVEVGAGELRVANASSVGWWSPVCP
jgi:hypothetical protein